MERSEGWGGSCESLTHHPMMALKRSRFSGSDSSLSSIGYCGDSSGVNSLGVPTPMHASRHSAASGSPVGFGYAHRAQSAQESARMRQVSSEEVAAKLKTFNETGRVEGFLADAAWFKNPLVKIEGDSRVIILGYGLLRHLCDEVTYDVHSSYAQSHDSFLIEAEVTYNWRWPFKHLMKPLCFHLFDSVHIRDATDDVVPEVSHQTISPGFREWQCYKIEQVWDASPSIGAHFVSTPFMRLTAVICYVYEAVVLFFAVLFALAA
eukprot:TRINITY_DN74604_c0_g1_i1.p2 TRINITY_DN74604_c0_g1~~TRINITY_DN74604_c0_g1_i1.p2  ORF type:complete len:264 (+),score=72.27 TRINITY_DN74604_c0_g1_i1:303-1094(+)